VWLGCLLLIVSAAAADDLERPRLKRFRAYNQDYTFTVTGILFPAFQPDIEEAILAGTPTTFEFYLYLKRERWYWDNEIIAHATYRHTVTYDTLRKTYTVVITRVGEDGILLTEATESRQRMQELMTHFQGTLEYSPDDLEYNEEYYVSLTASLTTRQLPSPWNKILFFLSSDFKTETSRKFFPVHN